MRLSPSRHAPRPRKTSLSKSYNCDSRTTSLSAVSQSTPFFVGYSEDQYDDIGASIRKNLELIAVSFSEMKRPSCPMKYARPSSPIPNTLKGLSEIY